MMAETWEEEAGGRLIWIARLPDGAGAGADMWIWGFVGGAGAIRGEWSAGPYFSEGVLRAEIQRVLGEAPEGPLSE